MMKFRAKYAILGLMLLAVLAAGQLAATPEVMARAGGGGSSSDWDFGDSDWGDSDWDWDSSDGSGGLDLGINAAIGTLPVWAQGIIYTTLTILVLALIYFGAKSFEEEQKRLAKKRKAPPGDPLRHQSRQLTEEEKRELAQRDATDREALVRRAENVFLDFQRAWSDWDTEAMAGFLTERYYARMVLELNVLHNMQRRNIMSDVKVNEVSIAEILREEDGTIKEFTARIRAQANDTLLDVRNNRPIHVTLNPFMEHWVFRRENDGLKLDRIHQATESFQLRENEFAQFADRQNFFYDPDFGWLMIPDRGVIFSQTHFGKSDINNHVIGYYRQKIVEFYSYIPSFTSEGRPTVNYIVAQAILPKRYNNVLIRKENNKWLDFLEKRLGKMRKIELEFPDFNKKFDVFAHPDDDISALELLNPLFMTKLYDLPFDVNIELVDNVIYLYTQKRDVSYEQMLDVLSMAFDEMKL